MRDIIVKATKKNYLIRKRACLERTFESKRQKLVYLKVPARKRKKVRVKRKALKSSPHFLLFSVFLAITREKAANFRYAA